MSRGLLLPVLLLQGVAMALTKPQISLQKLKQPRSSVAVGRGGALASAPAPAEEAPGLRGLLVRHRTPLLFGALVTQKVLADTLTDMTRRAGATAGRRCPCSEVAKFPCSPAIVVGGGAKRLKPTVVRAFRDTPLKIASRRWAALARRAPTLLGGGLTVLGALLSAVPNVWYEKILKTEGEDEWARNIQVTCWIFLWIAASQLGSAASAFRAGVPGAVAPWASPYAFGSSMIGSMEGITPAVWAVVALKSSTAS
ncbi:pyrimidine nucleotide-sugar transmembrane transporter [Aureococcus anophagefferens]|nr:pyrimidine nucleotide-sugar transmembrane transporter [Aureococcus anophagefferens]